MDMFAVDNLAVEVYNAQVAVDKPCLVVVLAVVGTPYLVVVGNLAVGEDKPFLV